MSEFSAEQQEANRKFFEDKVAALEAERVLARQAMGLGPSPAEDGSESGKSERDAGDSPRV